MKLRFGLALTIPLSALLSVCPHPDGAVLHVYIATRDREDERPSLAALKGVGQKVSSLAALGALRPLANAPA